MSGKPPRRKCSPPAPCRPTDMESPIPSGRLHGCLSRADWHRTPRCQGPRDVGRRETFCVYFPIYLLTASSFARLTNPDRCGNQSQLSGTWCPPVLLGATSSVERALVSGTKGAGFDPRVALHLLPFRSFLSTHSLSCTSASTEDSGNVISPTGRYDPRSTRVSGAHPPRHAGDPQLQGETPRAGPTQARRLADAD